MDETGTVVEECFGSENVEQHPAPTASIQKMQKERPLAASHLDRQDEDPASSSTVPSSPLRSDAILFSDNAPVASPPSSPPQLLLSPPPAARKPAFSFLKRKRSACDTAPLELVNEPLSDTTNNVLKLPPRPVKKPRLTQMQIDLGGEIRKMCPTCKMEYIPSNNEDSALHKEFHSMNVEGVDLGKGFSKYPGLNKIRCIKGLSREGETMAIVDRRSSGGAKKKVRKVLEVVNTELSAADVDDEQLWGGIESSTPVPEPRISKKGKANKGGSDKRGDRFKAFLYFDGDNCVGLCLAEKIGAACRVVDPQAERHDEQKVNPVSESSSISCSTTADVALLGISRLWTSKSHRGRGIAIDLLDCARGNFFYGMEVPKNLVAFSQPTESGGRLARRWFDAATGWHVYREGQ